MAHNRWVKVLYVVKLLHMLRFIVTKAVVGVSSNLKSYHRIVRLGVGALNLVGRVLTWLLYRDVRSTSRRAYAISGLEH